MTFKDITIEALREKNENNCSPQNSLEQELPVANDDLMENPKNQEKNSLIDNLIRNDEV